MSQNKATLDAIRRILLKAWHPIGVREAPQARDEYDGYAMRVFRALRDGAGADDLHRLLARISEDEIGLPGTSGDPGTAADQIVALAGQ